MTLSLLLLFGLALVLLALAASGIAARLRPAAQPMLPPVVLPAIGAVLALPALLGGSDFAGVPLPVGFAGSSGGLELDAISCLFTLLAFLTAAFSEWSQDLVRPSPDISPGLHPLLLAGTVLTMLAGDVLLLAIGGMLTILLLGRTAPIGRAAAAPGAAVSQVPGWPRRRIAAAGCLAGACALLAGAEIPPGALLPDAGFSLLRGEAGSLAGGYGSVLLPLLAIGATAPLLGLIPCGGWHRRLCMTTPAAVPVLASLLGVFLLLRLLLDLGGEAPPTWWGIALVLLGLLSATSGAHSALVATRLRGAVGSLLAAQNGFIVGGIGLCLLARSADLPVLAGAALDAVLLLVPVQLLSALAVLRLARTVEDEAGSDLLSRLGGLATSMPHAAPIALAGVVLLAFVPPAGGFGGIWLLLQAAFGMCRVGDPVLSATGGVALAGIVLATMLAAAAWLRLGATVFLGRPRTPRGAAAQDIPIGLGRTLVSLLALPILIGLFPGLWLRLLAPAGRLLASAASADLPPPFRLTLAGSGSSLSPLLLTLLLLLALVACLWARRRLSPIAARAEPAWEGGFAPPPPWLPFGDPVAQIGPSTLPRALHRAVAGDTALVPGLRGAPSRGQLLGFVRMVRRDSLRLQSRLHDQGALAALLLLVVVVAACGGWRFW